MSIRRESTRDHRKTRLLSLASRLGTGLLFVVAAGCAAEPGTHESIATTAEAMRWKQEIRLFGSNGASQDRFGSAVAADGSTLVVDARFGTGSTPHDGAAYVFVHDGVKWSQQTKLPTPSESNGGLDGAVAISGDTVVAGKTSDAPAGANSGAAYVFVRKGSLWAQEARLVADDGAAKDYFGVAVAISGDTIVVGASLESGVATNTGAAYVFTRSNGVWTQQQKLVADDAKAMDYFGRSLGIAMDTIVVGAFGSDSGGLDSGAAYVFTRSGASFGPPVKLTSPEITEGDRFGYNVAVAKDTLVVVADRDDDEVAGTTNVGAAYVYTRTGGTFGPAQRLLASDGISGYRFGLSVAVAADTIVVGAGNDVAPDSAAAYVFARSGATWVEQQKLVSVLGSPIDRFGATVAVAGDRIAVGADYDDFLASPDSGTVHVFQLRFEDGEACVDASKCLSGHCVDQVCCYSACTEAGMACSAAKKGQGNDGLCGPVAEVSTSSAGGAASATATSGAGGSGGAASAGSTSSTGGTSSEVRSYYSCSMGRGREPVSLPAVLVASTLAFAARSRRRRSPRAERRGVVAK
jgi:hypothetical protein